MFCVVAAWCRARLRTVIMAGRVRLRGRELSSTARSRSSWTGPDRPAPGSPIRRPSGTSSQPPNSTRGGGGSQYRQLVSTCQSVRVKLNDRGTRYSKKKISVFQRIVAVRCPSLTLTGERIHRRSLSGFPLTVSCTGDTYLQ